MRIDQITELITDRLDTLSQGELQEIYLDILNIDFTKLTPKQSTIIINFLGVLDDNSLLDFTEKFIDRVPNSVLLNSSPVDDIIDFIMPKIDILIEKAFRIN